MVEVPVSPGGLYTPLSNVGERDAFGRFRISAPAGLIDSQFQYDLQPQIFATSGDVTHLPNESSALLAIGTASGDRTICQSKEYLRYQPGKSQQIIVTFAFGPGQRGTKKRAGYYDDENGFYIQQNGSEMSLVKRSKSSGSVVETVVPKSNWNQDKADGTGRSTLSIDGEKAQIFMIDLEWLAVGSVRCYFVHDGNMYLLHEFRHSNRVEGAYMTTANLPVRWEIVNTQAQTATADMRAICSAVSSEGGVELERGIPFSASNGVTEVGASARVPILSVRVNEVFKGLTNRQKFELIEAMTIVRTNSAYVEYVVNGELTGPSWASVDSDSGLDYDVSASAITGGRTTFSSFGQEGSGNDSNLSRDQIGSKLPFGLDIDGKNGDVFSIVATPFAATSNISAAINWREIR